MSELSYVIVPRAAVRLEDLITHHPSLFASEDRLWLAPMQALTSAYFRKAFAECFPKSIDCAISPFISVTHGDITSSKRKFRDLLPNSNPESIDLVPQLLGANVEDMMSYLERLVVLGFNGVNINLSCPSKTVCRRGRGAILLDDYNKVDKLLRQITRQNALKISLKVRIGYDSTRDLPSLIDVLNSYPLQFVAVHPRLAVQLYEGAPDFSAFALFEDRLHHRLVYNGDIVSVQSFNEIKTRFARTRDFMLGRGLLANPRLAGEIRGMEFAPQLLETFFFKLQAYYRSDFLGIEDMDALPKQRQAMIRKAVLDKSKEFCRYFFGKSSLRLTACEDLESLNSIAIQMFRECYGLGTCQGT